MNSDKLISNNAEETESIGNNFAKSLSRGDVIYLSGDLGAGKTTFVKGIGRGLGVKSRVISPTFSIIRTHKVNNQKFDTLYHIDLYRIETPDDLVSLGLDEIFSDEQGVVLVEWPEKLGETRYEYSKQIKINLLEDGSREIQILS